MSNLGAAMAALSQESAIDNIQIDDASFEVIAAEVDGHYSTEGFAPL